jgi:hypothetical protein
MGFCFLRFLVIPYPTVSILMVRDRGSCGDCVMAVCRFELFW